MKYSILSQIIKGFWLIDEASAVGYLPFVASMIEGKNIEREEIKLPDFVAASFSATGKVSTYKKYDEAPMGSIAVLKVSGALMKADADCGGPADMATLSNQLLEADQHQNISGHILIVDSPGGTVDGTEEFASRVKSTLKPVVTYVDGLMASAAYWIGSSSQEIILSGKSSMVGSIGTMISLPSFKKYFEARGIEIHDIRADDSKDKNEAFYKAQEGDYKMIKQELLNPLNEVFLSAVKNNREGKLKGNNALTGKVFIGEDAIKEGLADSIGTFEFAIQRATELSNTQNKINQIKNPMKIKSAWAELVALLGFTQAASDQDLPAVSEEHLEKANSEIERLNGLQASLSAQNADLLQQAVNATELANQLSTDLANALVQIADLNILIEEYGAKAATVSTNPVKETDEIETTISFFDPNAEHNQIQFN